MPAAEGTSRTLIDAARAAGRRVILSRGWADLELVDDAPDCLAIGDVNHQALFPRVAAVVHHGGAGTTTAAARAGVAQVAVPMFSDQFYWGRRIRDLGIGTAVPFAGLSADALASALHEVLEPAVAARARFRRRERHPDGAAIRRAATGHPRAPVSRRKADDPSCLPWSAGLSRVSRGPNEARGCALPLLPLFESAAAIARPRAARSSLAVSSVS